MVIGRHDDTVVLILFADSGKNVFGRVSQCHCSVYVGLKGIRKRKRSFYDVGLVSALVFLQRTDCSCGVLTTLVNGDHIRSGEILINISITVSLSLGLMFECRLRVYIF